MSNLNLPCHSWAWYPLILIFWQMINSAFGKHLSNKHNRFLMQNEKKNEEKKLNFWHLLLWFWRFTCKPGEVGSSRFSEHQSQEAAETDSSKEYKPKGVPETAHPLMIYISKMNILSLLGIFSQFSANSPWTWVCKTVYIYIKPYENVPCSLFFFLLIVQFMPLTE